MDAVATELLQLVHTFADRLREVPEHDFTHNPLHLKHHLNQIFPGAL